MHTVFNKFPQRTWTVGETLWAAFYTQTENLKTLSASKSTVLSSSAVSILNVLARLSKVGQTPSELLAELRTYYPIKAATYRSVVGKLARYIGTLYLRINDSIEAVGDAIVDVLEEFESRLAERKKGRCENIDFKEMVKSIQFNLNLMAFINDIAVGGTFSKESYESLAISTLISSLLLISVHGVNANIGTVLNSENIDISPYLEQCFDVLDPIVTDVTKLISKSTFESVPNIKQFLDSFTSIVYSYNSSLVRVVGKCDNIGATTAEVNRNLKK